MDSLTQIVLGAAVGEAVLGRKIGNKAMLYGAIAGTIPDLDVLASHVTDTVTALEIHRGFTHSIVFSVVFAPIFGWLVTQYDSYKSVKDWSWLFFWAFITHPLLDAHTTWGTQLFWPLDLRIAYKNIFVIDPLYTVPFIVFLILAMRRKRTDAKRRTYNNIGLIFSSSYLVLSLILKGVAFTKFESALRQQYITYSDLDTRPAPLNTVLWTANVDTKDAYLVGDYSFFDTKPITFHKYLKQHELIADLKSNEKMQRMIHISKGWYTISKQDDTLYFNDLRFGTLSMGPNADNFVFQYEIVHDENGEIYFKETPKNPEDAKGLLQELWLRIKGN
ncbi:membrane-bound metal-dependent hydrolase [Formosa agariphila KMM 3901]|uniref:Membrane-bound metal-dependent hydrolase n=1 Tax=Formosa agariphila (strain DSM 15362 / KCTC 12365 / LMG 23005 / KMM 3901 / M-2Alg 35-1) TaxID=1347342 RepID=T2KLF3_FORAG|nr:metal-dependent hydrolase [Formosa agariphila]CDF79266.1 membrane-bound metal-dependent hydrolase [Formosa agariphila KMM 3901]